MVTPSEDELFVCTAARTVQVVAARSEVAELLLVVCAGIGAWLDHLSKILLSHAIIAVARMK
jgi:hypothetical protein